MAPRGRSLTASEHAYSDRSNDSSPDPLAISFDENITSSPRKPSPRKPMLASSPNKPGRRPGPSEMVFSSPSKSMVLSTPRGNGASPWRIKVTVQAEPEDGENAESPSVKRVTRTRTTTVPLKDPDASSPVKRPRGRPRKSETGSTPKPKRKATPIKRPAQFSSPTKIVGGGDSTAADVDTDIPPRKRRGRPRKSVEPSHYEENTAMGRPETTPESPREETPLPSAGTRSRSSEKGSPFAEPSRPDLQTMDDALRTSPTQSEPSPSLGTPAQSSMRNSLRERRGTPHANRVAILESDEDDDGALTPPSGDDDDDDLPEVQPLNELDDDQQDALTPSETSAQSSDSGDDASNAVGDVGSQNMQDYEDDDRDDRTQGQKFAFDEPTTRMLDDTTMLDGTFSMISVESLRNNIARPSPPKPQGVQTATASQAGSSLRHEYLGPATHVASEPERSTRDEQVSVAQASAETALTDPGRPKLSRHVTPAMDYEVPTAPPALQPVQPTPTKSPSPTLGRAVTAGVALQGLLDPNRLTPDASQKTSGAKRGSLDDLFRGFSSGTRKDLQAGLRLGEQLAQGQTEEDIAPGRSSPIRAQPTVAPKAGVFRTKRKYQQSRLLTPEDQDHVVTAAGPAVAASDVQYPVLDVEESDKTPMSPARSESAMSWRADTPPRAAGNQSQRDADMEEARGGVAGLAEEEPVQHDDFGDIWQEEASRSMISTHPEEPSAERSPKEQDLFTDASVVRPARGRVARTWRRKKVNEGTDSRREPAPERTEQDTQQSKDNEDDQKVDSAQPEEQHMQASKPNTEGEESDDAGMFFKPDVPSVSDQKRPAQFQRRRPRRPEAEKVSLSELLDQGESFVPESSPPTTTQKTPPKKTPPKAMANPFLDMPPRFAAIMSSPKKSSPLRRELHSGDISTSSVQQFEESTLPLAQSSPFHTVVDGDSKISAASDQQQFRMEMEGNTASTIVRVREEANEYLDAYEPQERSLNDIVEVTEMSRTHQDISQLPSSPPKMQQRFEQRLLSARKPSPLSKTAQRSEDAPTAQPRKPLARSKQPEVIELSSGSSSSEEPETSPSVAAQPAPQPAPRPAVTLSAKSTSSRLPEPQPQPQPHPILSRMTPLPKVEPWTRTHYKALDKLYTTHLKHPALFCPFNVPPTPLSRTNGHLLRRFLAENGNLPYVGAVFHAWGYSMVMTAELVVLCSVFMELMSLRSEFEYEQVAGRKLEIGNCAPGRRGDWISGEDVLQRLATVVMGESVRRDERAGREIDRSRSLYIEWPQTAGRS